MPRAALLAALLSLGASTVPAGAAILSTYDFSGTCSDCAGSGVGELVLSGYTLGQAIDDTNFMSFTYKGTDLFAPYTITADQLPALGGGIGGPLPDAEYVTISNGDVEFMSQKDGFWCTGVRYSCSSDTGTAHVWSTTAVTNVPEPVTATLLGGGLLGLVVLRRRG